MGASLILVTGAAGSVGAVGRSVVQDLRSRELPVRALVRREDERAAALRATGAEVVVGDLTRPVDVVRALDGCGRLYFGMGVSSQYLEAALVTAAAARAHQGLEAFVNMSQMTVSQMRLTSTDESTQQRQHWLTEQALDWSGLPVVQVRPTVFMENPLFRLAFASVARDGVLRLPFGTGRTSPVAARDVAAVVAEILANPAPHLGRVHELTGPVSQDLTAMAAELSAALHRPVGYDDPPHELWLEQDLRPLGLPDHVFDHLATMARLHAENRYDRVTREVELITGRPACGVREFAESHPELFTE
ncbi:NAD(P)H-binding protein [Kitasatospora sp. NPDC087314]|uniref:NAD(P)H-binding protein n=1 Tax=Kitasatospora sp. NPDC087314 TaxID=3364068 RepID=UPI003815A2BE